VVLASGGPGAIFPVTTQPRWNVGTGLALASLVGADLEDPGLLQVIPVTERGRRFPSTAALLRGRLSQGDKELRMGGGLEDVVAAMEAGGPLCWTPAREEDRLVVELLGPVAGSGHVLLPAAHFGLGGVAIYRDGRTSLPGLYAIGEAAAGYQGPGRMMGTGLLEARISGQRAAETVEQELKPVARKMSRTEALMVREPAFPDGLRSWLDKLTLPSPGAPTPVESLEALRKIQAWPEEQWGGHGAENWLLALRRAGALAFFLGGSGQKPLSLHDGSGYHTNSERK
jgi:L-aspartate oxidase